jgi:hypothetical protein
LADYAAQQAAFKGYETDYKNRIANTNLYTSPDTASTFLSTPNYSGIRGMRANLSDTTSADTTDYTNPNFSSMINDAYRSLGRVGIGTDTSNIDQTGYDYWMNQLQAGANGGIAPRDFKNQFKIATNDYIRQKPDDDYTKYIQGYLGILPAATLPVLPTTGGVTTSGTDVDQRAGEGPGANPGSAYDGGGMGTAGDLKDTLSGIGDWFGGLLGGSTGAAQASGIGSGATSNSLGFQAALDQEADLAAAAGLDATSENTGPDPNAFASGGPVSSPTSMEEALLHDRSRREFSDPRFEEIYNKYFYGDRGGVANPIDGEIARRRRQAFPGIPPMYTGAPRVLNNNPAELPQITGIDDDSERQGPPGPVSSPTSMEEALLHDRSRHEFPDPRFEEIYGKYFYDTGGTFIPDPRSALQKVLKYKGLLPGLFGRGPDIASPGDTPPPSLPPSFIPDPLSALQKALKYKGLLPELFGRGPDIASPSDSSAAERGASLGGFGDVPSSVGNPDDLMSLEDQRGKVIKIDDDSEQQGPPGPVPLSESGIRGRGVAPAQEPPPGTVTDPPPAPPTYEDQRNALYKRYLGPQSASPEMLAARQTAREAQANFVKMLNDQSSGETGPSEAEKYFRLASAMLAPTTTGKGAFFEAAGRAGQQMKEVEESTTKSKNVAQAAKLQRMLKSNEITWQVAKEELASIRAQEEGNRKDNLAIQLAELKDRRDQDDPKTELHRQLIGMGFVRGTDAYNKEYAKRTALADEAAALKQRQAEQNYNSLTSIEQRDLLGSERGLVEFEASMKKLREALDINDQTLPTGSFAGQSQDALKTKLGSNDPLVVNTARQAIMLSLVALGKLKLTFPGAISDKETAIMTKLQGINSATLDGRKRIIADALLDLEELKIEMIKHISDIKARKYRTYDPRLSPAGAAP